MRKAIKYSVVVIIGVIVAALIGLILLITLVNPNRFKDTISQAVYDRTGRQLVIQGDIHWTVFPWLGLTVGNGSLANAKTFGPAPFAEWQAATIQLQLLPLLEKKLAVDKLLLQGLVLNLAKNQQGQTNWQDLLTTAKQHKADTTVVQDKATGMPFALNIANVELKQAKITWTDQQKNHYWIFNNLSLKSSDIDFAANHFFPLQIISDLQMNQPALNGHVEFNSKIAIAPTLQQWQFQDLQLSGQLKGNKLPSGSLPFTVKSSKASVDLAQQTFEIANLTINLADIDILAKLQGKQLMTEPVIDGSIQIKPFNLQALLTKLQTKAINFADPQALTRVALNTDLAVSAQQVLLSHLLMQIDNSKLQGNLAVNYAAKPSFNFDLLLDQLNVNRYLPEASHTPATQANPPIATHGLSKPSTNNFKVWRGRGELAIGQLQINQITANQVMVVLNANNGIFNFNPIAAQLYQGNLSGSMQLDLSQNIPAMTVNPNLRGIQVEPLLNDLWGQQVKPFSGVANVSGEFRAHGNTANDMLNHLDGAAKFALSNGILHGVDLNYWISQAVSLLKKQGPTSTANTDQTSFGNLTGTMQINDGIATNNDLLLRSPQLQATGKGTINLPAKYLDYQLLATLLHPRTGEPQGELVPIAVTGPFSQLTVRPDVKAILQNQLQQQVDKVKNRLSEQINQNLGEQIKKLDIKSLFN